MRELVEKITVALWTTGMAVIWVVAVAALLLPLTFAADWWLGPSIDLFAHPRRNAVVLGIVLLIAALIRTFSPPDESASRSRWSIRKRR